MEKHHSTTSNLFRDKDGIIIVYDVTDMQSLSAVSSWMIEIGHFAKSERKLLMVGNKIDSEDRAVSKEKGQRLADKESLHYMEVSAQDGTGVKEAFRVFDP